MAGLFAHGTTVTIDSIPLGGVLTVPIPQEARDRVETTDQNSNFRREYVPGLIDTGTYSLPLRMIPGDPGQERLRAGIGDPDDIFEVVITLPEHAVERLFWTFNAYVATMGGELDWENTAAEREVELQITGAVEEGELSV